ncbi:MAG: hypothetical protein L3J52_02715, partial [Proteobacteria bacterium]|nr:hypothetical protein [Pseudomonadota bacterium]
VIKPQARWLMTMISMVWLLAFVPYGFNYYKQYMWLNDIYPEGKASSIINMVDDVLSDVSQQVYTLIVSEEFFAKNSRVYIYSPDRFSKLRLNYHLKNLNSAVLSYMNSEDLASSRTQSNYLLIYDNDNENTSCQEKFLKTHQLDKFRTVYSTEDYCLMEIL